MYLRKARLYMVSNLSLIYRFSQAQTWSSTFFRWYLLISENTLIEGVKEKMIFFFPLGIVPLSAGSREKYNDHSTTLVMSSNLVLILILTQLFIDRSSID